jgi:hypothetical protein
MPIVTPEQFTQNYNLAIGELIETRGGSFKASYLSWAHATRLLKERHPNLSVKLQTENGSPIHNHANQAFVLASVVDLESKLETPPILFPVMDNRFDPIENPSIMDINYACQRATAKVIAVVTGIGLKLYAGEDIPPATGEGHMPSTPKPNPTPKPANQVAESNEAPLPNDANAWQNAVVPIGKHKGKFLGNLHPKSRKWFLEKFEANTDYQDSVDFRNACNQCIAETGEAEPRDEFTAQSDETINEIAEQTANDPTDPELDEDVPF